MLLSAQPCFQQPGYSKFNLLKQCFLNDTEIDCRKIFKQVITDNGICCSANARLSVIHRIDIYHYEILS